MSLQINENTPVIIGAGQVKQDVPVNLETAIGPIEITAEAVKIALADAGELNVQGIDRLTAIRTFADSGPMFPCPFGTSKNMPASIAKRSGLTPKSLIYSAVGGDQPQTQIMESGKALYEGRATIAVICGGEAIANMKAAMRAGVSLDWSDDVETTELKDEGPFPEGLILSSEELRHGLLQPLQFYAMAETARRLELGDSVSDYQHKMGQLFAPFSERASHNPYSISPDAMSAKEIARPTDRNKMLAEPYTKAMIAKDAVVQGAAIVMTTYGKAKSMGLNPDNYVFLRGFAKTKDIFLSEREDVSQSSALTLAIKGALCSAGLETSEVKHADLYSCFPIVVERAKEVLENAPLKALTLTGGLPFFGGAGNNYSMHGIAEMVKTLRENKGEFGLVFANGGFMTKHSVGVYSTTPPDYNLFDRIVDFKADMKAKPKFEIDPNYEGRAALVSYALSYRSGQPKSAVVLGKVSDNSRVLARFESDLKTLSTLKKGQALDIKPTPKGHIAKLA